jgi:hypothetical protein
MGEIVKLGIALPISDAKIDTQFVLSFLALDKPENCQLFFPSIPSGNMDIGKIRTELCNQAIAADCTHLLMLDTDQVYHDQDLISRLLAHDKDIVGGKVHRRYPPFEPILNVDRQHVSDDEIDKGGLIKVDATGTGCLLIKLSCLDAIEKPWFEIKVNDDGSTVGEDIGFCYKAAAAGVDIYVDCGVDIGHLAVMQVNETFYKIWKKVTKVKL